MHRPLPLVLYLLCAHAATQTGVTAQLTALQPIVATWLNAPPNTPGASVSHPAGPLTSALVRVPVGSRPWAGEVAISLPANAWPSLHLATRNDTFFGDWVQTSADLLWQVNGPPTLHGEVRIDIAALGDAGAANGLLVDFGNDGVVEVDTAPSVGHWFNGLRSFPWDFAAGPLSVRIRHASTGGFPPQYYGLDLQFDPWYAGATDLGASCPQFTSQVADLHFDHRLAALPPTAPQDLSTLRATGFGSFTAFLISAQADVGPAPLPPRFGSCDLLTSIVFTAPGSATRVEAWYPVEWVARVPMLPPGFEFWAQHASLRQAATWELTLTNRIRVQT